MVRALLSMIVMAAVLAGASAAHADAAAVLDETFGGDGKATIPVGPGAGDEDAAYGVAVQDDGKIVLAGSSGAADSANFDFAVVRLNPNGTPDTSFGGDGKVVVDASSGLDHEIDEARAVAIDDDGRIVLAGYAGAPFPYSPGGDFAAIRLKPSGVLDGDFGGDGIVTVDLTETYGDAAADLAIDEAGRTVLAGAADSDFGLVRLNDDGTLDDAGGPDAGFGGDGIVTTSLSAAFVPESKASSVAIQPNGRIVAAGSAVVGDPMPTSFGLARYMPDGTLDPSFDIDGKAIVGISTNRMFPWDEATSLALQPDGKAVAAGWAMRKGGGFEDFALLRLRGDGTPDPGFGEGGKVTKPVSPIGESSGANAVLVQPDGRIVAVGRTVANVSKLNPLDYGFAAFKPDGSPDGSFACGSSTAVPIAPGDRLDVASGAALQTDGKIIAAGTSDMGGRTYSDLDFSAVRIDPSGPRADCRPPNTKIVAGPHGRTHDHSPRITFRSTERGSTFRCKLDAQRWRDCTSPTKLRGLSVGAHRFRVSATDKAGNTDPTPAVLRFKVR